MDLSTVKKNLKIGLYSHVENCLDDIQLIWDNCKLYNVDFSKIHKIACRLEEFTSKLVKETFGDKIEYGRNNPSFQSLQEKMNSKDSLEEFINKS